MLLLLKRNTIYDKGTIACSISEETEHDHLMLLKFQFFFTPTAVKISTVYIDILFRIIVSG